MMDGIKDVVIAAALSVALIGCGAAPPKPSSGAQADDSGIVTKVRTALLKDSDVKGTAINVEVVGATVQLSGFVRSEHERKRAEALARGVAGVENVENDLRLQQSP